MKIIFSKHAMVKLAQRKIRRSFVVEIVFHPDFTKPSYSFREERFKSFGKNFIKAIVVKEDGTITVVTAHWVAKSK